MHIADHVCLTYLYIGYIGYTAVRQEFVVVGRGQMQTHITGGLCAYRGGALHQQVHAEPN